MGDLRDAGEMGRYGGAQIIDNARRTAVFQRTQIEGGHRSRRRERERAAFRCGK